VQRHAYTAALAASLLLAGCSSTLNEYKCESSVDCIGAEVGVCESSGHCSFADDTCPSGFRFGDNAGSETNTCVASEDEPPDAATVDPPVDAGLPDAIDPFAPLAVIDPVSFDCDRTNEEIVGIRSEAYDGRTLARFEWTVLDSEGQEITSIAGAPKDATLRSTHVRGGPFEKPRINVTQYHNSHGVQVDVVTPTDSGGQALVQELDFTNNNAPHRLHFTIGSEDLAASLTATARLLDSGGNPLLQQAVLVGATMEAHNFDMPMDLDFPQPMSLEFRFDQAVRFWVDNVSVVDLNDGDNLVDHGSGEFGGNEWDVVDDVKSEDATIADLPASLKKNGLYKIQLVVVDSADVRSLPVSVDVTVADCP
jgi:hypothetical protein